jgi:hypothetical protein
MAIELSCGTGRACPLRVNFVILAELGRAD